MTDKFIDVVKVVFRPGFPVVDTPQLRSKVQTAARRQLYAKGITRGVYRVDVFEFRAPPEANHLVLQFAIRDGVLGRLS